MLLHQSNYEYLPIDVILLKNGTLTLLAITTQCMDQLAREVLQVRGSIVRSYDFQEFLQRKLITWDKLYHIIYIVTFN